MKNQINAVHLRILIPIRLKIAVYLPGFKIYGRLNSKSKILIEMFQQDIIIVWTINTTKFELQIPC